MKAHSANTPAVVPQLHVVLHGLIAVRFSKLKKSVMLCFPEVTGQMPHVYRAGDYMDLRTIRRGAKMRLRVPGATKLFQQPDTSCFEQTYLTVSLSKIGQSGMASKFHPSTKLHASVELPWPDNANRVRLPKSNGAPQMTYMNGQSYSPLQMGYISYLSYNLNSKAPVVLRNGLREFWFSEHLDVHTCLHFFADPMMPMNQEQRRKHVTLAYDAFNKQLFNPKFDLAEQQRGTWSDPDSGSPDIPANEQCDKFLNSPPNSKVVILNDVGNCLSAFIID